MRRLLNNIGSFFWMLMDICWMSKNITFACVFMIIAIVLLIIPPKDSDEIGGFVATISWLLMNSTWMLDDIAGEKIVELSVLKYIFMCTGIIGVGIVLFSDTKHLAKIRRFK